MAATGCGGGKLPPARDAAGLLQAADEDLRSNRAEAAQRSYEAALQLEPLLLPAVRGRIESARRRGALPAIVAEAAARAEANPQDALSFYTLGLARFGQGEEKTAAQALRRAVELKPDEADFHFRLGVLLFDGEHFAEAKAPLQRAVDLAPRAPRYRPPLAACLARLGDRRAAVQVLRMVPDLSPTADEASLAVKTARTLADPFRDVPQPARADLELALGYLLRDAPGLALPYLEGLVAKFPELASAHALLGLTAQRLDEAGRAVTELQKAAELAPDSAQPHLYLAELYAGRDRPELAEQEYAAALERDPLDVSTLRKLGELRLARIGPSANAQPAVEPLHRAAALSPADTGLQLLLARAEAQSGQAPAARARLEGLADKRPDDAEVLLRLAMLLYEERGNAAASAREQLTERLQALLEKVLALQPQNAAASRLLTALRSG